MNHITIVLILCELKFFMISTFCLSSTVLIFSNVASNTCLFFLLVNNINNLLFFDNLLYLTFVLVFLLLRSQIISTSVFFIGESNRHCYIFLRFLLFISFLFRGFELYIVYEFFLHFINVILLMLFQILSKLNWTN